MDELVFFVPKRYADHRGFFSETYSALKFQKLGVPLDFVQDNQSISIETGTVRGLHFQSPPYAQGKLVRCGFGAIFDVAVDIREGSPTYGQWRGYELSAENGAQLYVPPGFAHGFITLSPMSEVLYKCTAYYHPESEGCVRWDDPELGINWPIKSSPVLSEKDQAALTLRELKTPFRFGVNS
jgi:dTDP-4-dehydrorhamnose 3,5-epimerase